MLRREPGHRIGEVTWAARTVVELVGDMKDMVGHADAR